MTNKQPSETAELANASYVWRKKVQEDLLDVLRDPSITVEKATWWFERWTNAKLREIEYEKLAAEERNK
jgi:hypothetical protein